MIIQDDFLKDFDGFRTYCDRLPYTGHYNPVDGEFYPGVELGVPTLILAEIKHKIECLVSHAIKVNFCFLRLMLEGMQQPHQVHTDATMGEKTFILYLNRPGHCSGGTALVVHKTGFDGDPLTPAQVAIWEQDHQNLDAWIITEHCNMAPNRACIFDSKRLHRAEPVQGFGTTPEDGRLALTVFFNEDKTRH